MTLTEFLLARIAEDEADANRAARGGGSWTMREEYQAWGVYRGPDASGNWGHVTFDSEGLSDSVDEDDGPHIARWDPERVLAECEAKRAIVALLIESQRILREDARNEYQKAAARQGISIARLSCQALATAYADHPDYDEAWRP